MYISVDSREPIYAVRPRNGKPHSSSVVIYGDCAPLRASLAEIIADDQSCPPEHEARLVDAIMSGLAEEGFEFEWPFFEIPDHAHRVAYWISGFAGDGLSCTVCAVFDAPDEAAIVAEVGAREDRTIEVKADGWTPSDEHGFLMDEEAAK